MTIQTAQTPVSIEWDDSVVIVLEDAISIVYTTFTVQNFTFQTLCSLAG